MSLLIGWKLEPNDCAHKLGLTLMFHIYKKKIKFSQVYHFRPKLPKAIKGTKKKEKKPLRRHRRMGNKDTHTHTGACGVKVEKSKAWSEREGQKVPTASQPSNTSKSVIYLFNQSLWKDMETRPQLGLVRSLLSGCLATHLWHVQLVWEHKHCLNMKREVSEEGRRKIWTCRCLGEGVFQAKTCYFCFKTIKWKPHCIKRWFWCSWHACPFMVMHM